MRLNSLDITRYGKFTDHVIDFGQPVEGQPDLHIIYGPNEAGKSTAYSAFLDLLFGIEERSRFNFIHPYSAMRIGAVLDMADGPLEVARIKHRQRSLLDGNDRPIAEGLLQTELAGLDREAYRMMFSLDDDTLEAGGESILASKGDLGQLLFAASTGLADLSRALIDLKAEADSFYKYRARNGELQELKTELASLKAEREKIDTFAAEYAQLVKARDRAKAQYEEAITERGRTQARIENTGRYLSALPRLAALRSVRGKLAQFGELPDVPDSWPKDLPALQTEEIELGTRLKEAEAEIERINAELDAIDTDKTALRLADRIDTLVDFRARHDTAENDLPERRLQLQELELRIKGILARLGKSDVSEPARLVLDASTIGILRELIETRSGIEASVEAAKRELEAAKERLDEARAKQQQTTGGDGSAGEERETKIAALTAIVDKLRGSDHQARLQLAERSCRDNRETLQLRMAELRPWPGSDDQLADLIVPLPGDIERWREALIEANGLIDRHEAEIDRLEAERRRVQAKLDTISNVEGVVSEGDAAKVRAEREETWVTHRREMNEASAAAFEAVLRRDDIVVNARLRHEAEIARLHEANAKLAEVNADIQSCGERLKTALASRQAVHDELAAYLLSMTPRLPDFALSQLEAWLSRREKALEARAGLKRAEQDLDEAKADISAAREALSNALTALGLSHDPETSHETLLVMAQSVVDREAKLDMLRENLRNRNGEVKAREREFQKASEADKAWRASWSEACSDAWLGEGATAPSVAVVREILAALSELGPAVESRVSLAQRIRKMEADRVRFRDEVIAIAEGLALDAKSGDAITLSHQMADRLQQSRVARSTKAARMQDLKKARARQRDLLSSQAIHNRRAEEMTAFLQVYSLAEVAVKLQEIAKRAELTRQAEEAECEILETLGLPTIEAAETALDKSDRAALETELAEFKGRLGDQDERARELFASDRKAFDQIEAVGGDNAAAEIEEKRRTVLLQIEEKARSYMRLRLGIVAAGHALHLYRDKHRSSMMARASSTFRAISREAYTTLTTQLEKDSEILIAVAADGSSKVASELSKGTRFQLYLALRVAGYYEFAQSRPVVPFIADDIMETFDEFRSEETFKVFAEMAQVGQVIYLTHHRHLCEIAQDVCSSVRVHDLTAPSMRQQPLTRVA
jgi:uncharacterized protein YhaN